MVYRVNKSDTTKTFHSTAAATPGTAARTITANYGLKRWRKLISSARYFCKKMVRVETMV